MRTSEEDTNYNCIAWAAGDTRRKWWPDPFGVGYWPVDRQENLPTFVAAFRSIGYELCLDGSVEFGFEKIAMYADRHGEPKHMARQLPNGQWTSKLGDLEDIEHATLHGLEDTTYGDAVQFMKRPTA